MIHAGFSLLEFLKKGDFETVSLKFTIDLFIPLLKIMSVIRCLQSARKNGLTPAGKVTNKLSTIILLF